MTAREGGREGGRGGDIAWRSSKKRRGEGGTGTGRSRINIEIWAAYKVCGAFFFSTFFKEHAKLPFSP